MIKPGSKKLLMGGVVACVLGSFTSLEAQEATLRGHTYDASTGLPLGGVRVRVLGSTVSTLSEETGGFFTISDIPRGAVLGDVVELLLTKDGFVPETILQKLTDQRVALAISPEKSQIDIWMERLREGGSCATRQEIVEIIANRAHEHPALRIAAEDALLQIKAGYGFPYSRAERWVAGRCFELLKGDTACDQASEDFDQAFEERMDSEDDGGMEGGPRVAVALMLECLRPDEEAAAAFGGVIEGIVSSAWVVIEGDGCREIGFESGTVILSFGDESVDSLDEWDQLLAASPDEERILQAKSPAGEVLSMRATGSQLRDCTVRRARPDDLSFDGD